MVLPFTYSAPHPFCCSSCQISLYKQIFFLNGRVSRVTGLLHISLPSLPHTFFWLIFVRLILKYFCCGSSRCICWCSLSVFLEQIPRLMWIGTNAFSSRKRCSRASAEDVVPVVWSCGTSCPSLHVNQGLLILLWAAALMSASLPWCQGLQMAQQSLWWDPFSRISGEIGE